MLRIQRNTFAFQPVGNYKLKLWRGQGDSKKIVHKANVKGKEKNDE